MSTYVFFECTQPDCRLRFPLDTDTHQGRFCPVCGGELRTMPVSQDVPVSTSEAAQPSRRVCAILDNIRSAFNVGGIFRTADGAGVEHLYLCGITPTPADHPNMSKTALGAENEVQWSHHLNALAVAKDLKMAGAYLVALERTPESIPIQNFLLDDIDGGIIGLVVGHECAGVDPGLLDLCDAVISLPMVGGKSSLNVAVAFGAAAYWLAFSQNPGV